MNTRLFLQYDGSKYFGYQRQLNQITVQEMLERAIEQAVKKPITLYGCSRTDSKVHALTYCCNFREEHTIPMERLPVALNSRLPRDIRILGAEAAEEEFHARYSARSKTYLYRVWNHPTANAFFANYAWHYPYALKLDAIRQAMPQFLGRHDFSAFMSAGGHQHTTIRTINRLELFERDGFLEFEINADAYLYNMVRIIIGTLLYVGTGRILPEAVSGILESGKRKNAGITAEPQGLYLKEVFYS